MLKEIWTWSGEYILYFGTVFTSEGVWLKFNRQLFFVWNDTVVENSTVTCMNKLLYDWQKLLIEEGHNFYFPADIKAN